MMAKTAKKVAIQPLGDKVLVKRLEAADVTSGGIVLPDSAKEKPREGTVIALGDGRLLDDGKRTEFAYRMAWARTRLKKDGLIESLGPRLWGLTADAQAP